jgi:hypothetical protein
MDNFRKSLKINTSMTHDEAKYFKRFIIYHSYFIIKSNFLFQNPPNVNTFFKPLLKNGYDFKT